MEKGISDVLASLFTLSLDLNESSLIQPDVPEPVPVIRIVFDCDDAFRIVDDVDARIIAGYVHDVCGLAREPDARGRVQRAVAPAAAIDSHLDVGKWEFRRPIFVAVYECV